MARAKSKTGSLSGYFRELFEEHPEWLKEKSNSAILDRYRQDHGLAPDAPLEKRITTNLANLKSQLRKKKGLGAYRGRRTRRKQEAAAAKTSPTSSTMSNSKMENLEERIDECLTMARNFDPEGSELGDVVKLLRRARNEVVWKLGQ